LEGFGGDFETSCIVTSSGMAAIQSAIDPFLVTLQGQSADTINFVASAQVYGGTYQQFRMRKQCDRNIEWRKVIHTTDLQEWESRIDENTRFLYGELPSNPGLGFFDIKAVADVAHKHNIPLIIDSTVATPALLRPLLYGADIVVQSVTKSLFSSGFGICGAVIARKNITSNIDNPEMKADFAQYLKLLPNRDNGPNVSPMNAILALNDIRTIRSRMDLFSRSSATVAGFLEKHPHVDYVDYLGLESHSLHELASRYMFLVDSEFDEVYRKKINRFGHLLSFQIKGDAKNTREVFDALTMIWRATDLGRIKSVATIPAISTHLQQGEEGRNLAGIPDNLIRLCIGGEHPDDIIKDLDQALSVLDGLKINMTFPEFSAGGASSALINKEE